MTWRMAIDIGGAFTDLFAYNEETGETVWIKVDSTPPDYSQGVVEAVRRSKIDLTDVFYIVHGQTVVINTIITRSGSTVGLVTTRGFDVLDIGRANRRDLFNLRYRKPDPLVPRHLTERVDERILSDGTVLVKLNPDEVREAVRRLLSKGIESLVISYINSYANPLHERVSKEIAEEEFVRVGKIPFVTASHELTREWREYERTMTAVLNAYVQPIFYRYVEKLEKAFREMGFKGTFYIMTSSAGYVSADYARKYPVKCVEGGPIAGIVGATVLGEILGEKNLIVMDGGSTTTKVGLVENLNLKTTTEYYVERDRFRAGYPVRVHTVDIIETGNGGTSIAWIDENKKLRVGPKAAGSYPGPACYGRGGSEPTLTDAYVHNGFLNREYLLGGELRLYAHLAEKALRKLAEFYDVSVEDVADAIIRIANDQAARVVKLASVQRGYDPRDFTLVPHGGSGPMFAPFVALELGINKIVVPAIPLGIFNAWGMLVSDIKHELSHTSVTKIPMSDIGNDIIEKVNKVYEDLERELLALFTQEGIELERVIVSRYADMRYYGQEWVLRVPAPPGKVGLRDIYTLLESFEEAHYREYGFRLPGNPVEIVTYHVVGVVRVKKLGLKPREEKSLSLDKAYLMHREVYLGKDRGFENVPVYQKELLPPEVSFKGPAIVEERTSTIIVLKEFDVKVDRYGNIIMLAKR